MSRKRVSKRGAGPAAGGAPVYRGCDDWGEILVVDRRSLRTLTFGSGFEQTCMDLKDPSLLVHDYARAMMLVMAFIQPTAVTVLGVGGGALIRSVAQLHPQADLVGVELRPEVLEIAREWFQLPAGDTLSFRIEDADAHLRASVHGSTDVILSDLYHAWGMSPLQRQEQFLSQCHRVLVDHGWLVINVSAGTDLTPITATLDGLFADVLLCPVDSANQIVLASKQPLAGPLSDYFERVATLERQLNVRLDLLFRRLSRLAAAVPSRGRSDAGAT